MKKMKKLLVAVIGLFIIIGVFLFLFNRNKVVDDFEVPKSIGFTIHSQEGIRLYRENFKLEEDVYEYEIEIPIQKGLKITEAFDINVFTDYGYGYSFLTEEEFQVITVDVEDLIYTFNFHFNFYSNEFIENYKKENNKILYYEKDESCKKIEDCNFIYEKDL